MNWNAIQRGESNQRILRRLIARTYLIFIYLGFSCSFFQGDASNAREKGKLLAKVGENKLYERDLLGIVPMNTPSEDSTSLADRYVNAWIRKQLVLEKAQASMVLDEAEIERKLLDYKYDLITYEYQSDYIKENLDTLVSEEDIAAYYENNQANFKLRQDIGKGILVKVPNSLNTLNELRVLLSSNKAEDFPKLREYCIKFADLYQLNDSTWFNFPELVKGTPLNQMTGNDVMANKGSVIERNDGEFFYLLKVKDFVLANTIAPKDFVSERIATTIINQRKVKLTKALEQEIFEEGKKNKSFEIYN